MNGIVGGIFILGDNSRKEVSTLLQRQEWQRAMQTRE
jgi:hypothetical protein